MVKAIRKIITSEVMEVFFWMHSGFLTPEEVRAFFNMEADEELLKKVAYYILLYAENLTLRAYILSAEDKEYLSYALGYLEQLREIYGRIEREGANMELVREMLKICLENGIDPF